MKIGVTERGDAALDFSWVPKLNDVDGAILITKNVSAEFREQVFPKDQVVLRIDPIIPTAEGVIRVENVLMTALSMGLLPAMRVRISILDNYKHVQQRFALAGLEPLYGGYFNAPADEWLRVQGLLCRFQNITFETCAEKNIPTPNAKQVGCVSYADLSIMGLPTPSMDENPQNRKNCLCLSCKTELLINRCRCGHKCLYCYWKG